MIMNLILVSPLVTVGGAGRADSLRGLALTNTSNRPGRNRHARDFSRGRSLGRETPQADGAKVCAMFARVVFALAGLYGLGALVPLYQQAATTLDYGLLGAVAAWQVMFLLIAWRPAELRLAMIPCVLEKLFWCITLVVLWAHGSATSVELAGGAIPHGLLGLLFAFAYFRTSRRVTQAPSIPG
jgi:hypothetical protein